METAGLAVMDDDDRKHQDALVAAGYTGRRGTILFCALLAVFGAMFGSVVFAILLSFAMPENSVAENTIVGTAAGVALGIWIGLVKIRRGNREAIEHLHDREWRRLALRQFVDKGR